LSIETVVSRQRALILAIGELAAAGRLADEQRLAATTDLAQRYADDPDAGVHGAAEWALWQLDADQEIATVREAYASAKREELVVITKMYDLVLWSCHHTSRFPRNHRFVLGERIERQLYDLLETLIQAKYRRERSTLLDNANLRLEILRFQLRLAKDLQCRKFKSYEFASRAVDEIGRLLGGCSEVARRLLGGWSEVGRSDR
jgi:hypothetical protein